MQHAEGMFATLVNGAVLFQQGEHQGRDARPALRSDGVLASGRLATN